MSTEKEKMLNGKIYDPTDEELAKLRTRAHILSKDYNDTYETDEEKRKEILSALVPNRGKGLYLQGPIQFDYGVFTTFGDNCYANFNFTVLDCCPVKIGNDVFFGPNCTIATPIHPLLSKERNMRFRPDGTAYDLEYAAPITIGNSCWIASNVVICGGVTIGDNCVIGAGSVVTRDIPSDSFAVGNPCRVVRKITSEDSIEMRYNLLK
jgi:maltose O-acetyltransferase